MAEDIVQVVQKKVENYLGDLFGDEFQKFDEGRFTAPEGSTIVQVVVRPWHEKDAIVESSCHVVYGAEITEDLMYYLLRENAKMHFGAFSLNFDDTILFGHSIAGANLDPNELEATIRTVARVSDYYDDEIIEIAGGKTAQEATAEALE